jgi:hypothetical protein
MALEGTIKEFGLADIFQLIGLQKKTGTLFLKGPDGTVNIHFEDGMVVKAEDSQKRPKYLCGNILLRRGKIAERQLQQALEIQKSTAQKLGNVLISQGLLNKEELRDMLSFQLREAIYKVFRWKGGDYKFYQDRVDYDRDTVVPISSEHLLMDGIRMLDEWPMIEKKLPGQDVVLRRNDNSGFVEEEDQGEDIFGGFDEKGSKTGLSKELSHVLDLVDGKRSIYEIIEESCLGEFDTSKSLVELLDGGHVTKTDSRPYMVLEEISAPAIKKRPVSLEKLPYVFLALALIFVFLQITGTRRIMNPRETRFQGLKNSFAMGQVERAHDNAELYYMESGQYPNDTLSLAKLDYILDNDTTDPWGNPLVLSLSRGGSIIVSSAGPDRTLGSEDDISSMP